MNIIYCSQFSDSCGYAVAARGYLKALDSVIKKRNDINLKIFDVSVESISKLKDSEKDLLSKYSFNNNKEIDEILDKDYICLWHYPTSFYNLTKAYSHLDKKWFYLEQIISKSKKNINYTTWESDKLPSNWLPIYHNLKTQSIIVPCTWNRQVFSKETNINTFVLPHVLEEKDIVDSTPIEDLQSIIKDKFVVFSMSQWQNRKGFDKLIQSFCMEFKNQEDVILIIKTYGVLMGDYQNNKNSQKQKITNDILNYKNSVFLSDGSNPKTKIVAITDVLPYENIAWLYKQSNLFSLLSRGEGFGLTVAEAAINKVPIMVTNATGYMDFIDVDNSFLVDSHKHPYVEKPEYSCDMNWYEPDLLSARNNLRKAYNMWKNHPEKLSNMGINNYNFLKKLNFSSENIGNKLLNILEK